MGSLYQLHIHLSEAKNYTFQKVTVIIDGQIVELWLLVPCSIEEKNELLLN